MSIHVINWVWHYSAAEGTDLLVALALADNAGDDGRAFPGQEYLAKKTRLSESTVRRALRQLEAIGEIDTQRHSGPYWAGPRRVNVYRFLTPDGRADRIPKADFQGGQPDRLTELQGGQRAHARRSTGPGKPVKLVTGKPSVTRNNQECSQHRGQLLRSCSLCRSEQIGVG